MASDPQVQRLLDEILELGKTPEEVCRDYTLAEGEPACTTGYGEGSRR